jgi:hypothetical protein
MVPTKGFMAIAVMVAAAAARGNAAELQRETAGASQEYLQRAGVRLQGRLDAGKPFL